MAADSAVSVGDGVKIYQSAIKLFTLSKYEPVGVMVYHTASILGYPWETIIKSFRHHLGNRTCPTIADYAKEFRGFLHTNEKGLFNPRLQKMNVLNSAHDEIIKLLTGVRSKYWEGFPDGKPVVKVLEDAINAQMGSAGKTNVMDCFEPEFQTAVMEEYGPDLANLAQTMASENLNFGIGEADALEMGRLIAEIANLMVMRLVRDPKFGNYSGMVFAGFGTDEYLPAMSHIVIDGVLCDHLKWKLEQNISVEPTGSSVIQPFAQSQMVSTFINGVDPSLRTLGAVGSIRMGVELSELIVNSIDDLSPERKEHWKGVSRAAAIEAWEKYQDSLSEHIRENHQYPLQRIIGSLPKDELAEVAESMVSLNALKMKVSQAKETVGGPIDVAVITKGDGFIWIKRKHYFSQELNPHFGANYYRSDEGISAHAGVSKKAPAKSRRKGKTDGLK